jgi:riboflavin biosynthesis pyrimidine reductase
MRALLSPSTDLADELERADLVGLYRFPVIADEPETSWVRAVFVNTLDGSAQGPDHRSGLLSSVADASLFALQRSLCDVILVGAATARGEGYRRVLASELDRTARTAVGLTGIPTIAVVSRSLDLDPELLAGSDGPGGPVLAITSRAAPADAVARVAAACEVVVCGDDVVDPHLVVAALQERHLRRVLCEGGPTLFAGMLAAGRVDDLCLTTTPLLVAGDHPRITNGKDLAPPARLQLAHLLEEGGDLFARYLVVRPA